MESLIFQDSGGGGLLVKKWIDDMRSCKAVKMYLWVLIGNFFQDLWQRKSKKDTQLKDKLIILLKL